MDWIDAFMEYTEGIPSPQIFRQWSAITALSGALERRCKVRTGQGDVFPNLYTFLVAPPAVGKSQAISRISDLWKAVKELKCAPDNVTKAALVDALHDAERNEDSNAIEKLVNKIRMGAKDEFAGQYHTLLVATSELGVLIHRHDLEFISLLNNIYDNPETYREERRTMQGRQVDIVRPQLVVLAGTQPDFLASIFPDESYGMGFMSRLIMVYASEAPKISLFAPPPPTNLRGVLIDGLTKRLGMSGTFKWEPSAEALIEQWYADGLPPIPDHAKLLHYRGRRLLHILKLSMIASTSRGTDMIITKEDYLRAKGWLLDAEARMPDIFRAMYSKSDVEVLQELHFHVWRQWASNEPAKRIPVPQNVLYEFLKFRVPSEKIERIIDVAEKSGMLQHCPGGGWIPRPPGLANIN